ncbi:AAA family ATPase [Pseudaquabacterium rugosum]|uniref:AAA family ATPase n=1 Tax=Pseudaquabacterium rugosum TaxID=2984194 RepID=A0ABU9BAJ7_9BURK
MSATMLESVHIQNFKGFRDTRIDGFCPVNLVIGGQNVGKTSLLEAVLFAFREKVSADFRSQDEGDAQRLIGAVCGRARYLLQASANGRDYGIAARGTAEGRFTAIRQVAKGHTASAILYPSGEKPPICLGLPLFLPFQSRFVDLWGQVVFGRKKQALLGLLRSIEPRLISLDAIAPDGEQRLYAELDGVPQALPLSHLGHGFSRLVHLFSELLVSDASLALIDEIENSIHYSALPTLFQGVRAVAQERQVQTLMTTHSWDALRAASEVFADTPELFQVIRLERTADDNVEAVRIDVPRLQRLIDQDREVR